MANPRKNSYGQTIRIDCGIDMSQFSDITVIGSCSSNVSSLTFNLSASTLFIGNSTVYSSSLGQPLTSGEWVYCAGTSTEAWVTADVYTLKVHASATGKYWISPDVLISVDA